MLVYITCNCPEVNENRSLEYNQFDWDSLVNDLLKLHVDEHIYKLVYVSKEENEELKSTKRESILDEKFYYNFAMVSSLINNKWIFI